jgi:hypothetical protein
VVLAGGAAIAAVTFFLVKKYKRNGQSSNFHRFDLMEEKSAAEVETL